MLHIWLQMQADWCGSIPGWSYLGGNNFHALLKTYPETMLTTTLKSFKKGKDSFFCLPLSATCQLLLNGVVLMGRSPLSLRIHGPNAVGRELTMVRQSTCHKTYSLVQWGGEDQVTLLSAGAQIAREPVMSDLLEASTLYMVLQNSRFHLKTRNN